MQFTWGKTEKFGPDRRRTTPPLVIASHLIAIAATGMLQPPGRPVAETAQGRPGGLLDIRPVWLGKGQNKATSTRQAIRLKVG